LGLRGYGQRDPLNEYKNEAFELFESFLAKLRTETVEQLMHARIQLAPPPLESTPLPQMHAMHLDPLTGQNEMEQPGAHWADVPAVDPNNPATWGRTSRNAPCPCGSGRKFKHCHGALA
jgi:preprotein translocase subunit SecA